MQWATSCVGFEIKDFHAAEIKTDDPVPVATMTVDMTMVTVERER